MTPAIMDAKKAKRCCLRALMIMSWKGTATNALKNPRMYTMLMLFGSGMINNNVNVSVNPKLIL